MSIEPAVTAAEPGAGLAAGAAPLALPTPRTPGRSGTLRLVATITGYGLRSFVRSPVAAFFTWPATLTLFCGLAVL
ncbi:MAG TPA: hypothetical protein VFB84_16750 [Micromonosporaceae bacterium]|nr:hypothetical protein [Micromonosporaceae bacterium]